MLTPDCRELKRKLKAIDIEVSSIAPPYNMTYTSYPGSKHVRSAKDGGDDEARTRDLRRDRPAL